MCGRMFAAPFGFVGDMGGKQAGVEGVGHSLGGQVGNGGGVGIGELSGDRAPGTDAGVEGIPM